ASPSRETTRPAPRRASCRAASSRARGASRSSNDRLLMSPQLYPRARVCGKGQALAPAWPGRCAALAPARVCPYPGAVMSTEDHMHVRPWRAIDRRKSRQIHVGSVAVGGDAPITVQSMTNTLTADANATIGQIRELEEAGADIVRVSCPDEESTAAMPAIT